VEQVVKRLEPFQCGLFDGEFGKCGHSLLEHGFLCFAICSNLINPWFIPVPGFLDVDAEPLAWVFRIL
jgi:hypothetical protein